MRVPYPWVINEITRREERREERPALRIPLRAPEERELPRAEEREDDECVVSLI